MEKGRKATARAWDSTWGEQVEGAPALREDDAPLITGHTYCAALCKAQACRQANTMEPAAQPRLVPAAVKINSCFVPHMLSSV